MDRQRLHLIYNAMSGAFVRGLDITELRDSIRAAGWTISGETNLETDELIDLAALKGSGVDVIAIAGGDGTLISVLNELAGLDDVPPALILPCGTANLLARYVHDTIDIDAILDGALRAETRWLPLGEANGHLFAVSPALVKFREDIRRIGFFGRARRSLAYLRVGWRSFFRQPFLTDIEGESGPRRATAIYVTCPDAIVEDGKFLVFGGRMKTVADLISGLAMAALPGVDEAGRNWTVETRRLTVRSPRAIPLILDGEPAIMSSPVTLEFGHKRVQVLSV
ncbi:diacylglycerol/lipid kinase family protein [Hyphobacterium sp.]|uniref:diacylglycerol/lipid kinase family protein n=1 Tax=Hyphobacterium sp. TaxID=2004662 RepID=UPI003748CE9C